MILGWQIQGLPTVTVFRRHKKAEPSQTDGSAVSVGLLSSSLVLEIADKPEQTETAAASVALLSGDLRNPTRTAPGIDPETAAASVVLLSGSVVRQLIDASAIDPETAAASVVLLSGSLST